MSAIDRFAASIYLDNATGCWVWTKHTVAGGYGELRVNGREKLAHRFSYEFFRAPIPTGLQLDHLCKNRSCCNPWHLEPVTPQENSVQRSVLSPTAINSRKLFCKRGHALKGANIYRSKKGRECLTCKRLLRRRHYRKTL